jgi:hypothetical protein
MARKEYEVRVRPYRIACLLPFSAKREELLLALDFYSHLWGGRYCSLVPVREEGGNTENELSIRWLSKTRPDIVCGIGVDHQKWQKICYDSFQPYVYLDLDKRKMSEILGSPLIGLMTGTSIFLNTLRKNPITDSSNVILVRTPKECNLAALISATFGSYDKELLDWLGKGFRVEIREIPNKLSVADYIRICIDSSGKFSALDLASYGLRRHIISGGFLPKTIVVNENNIADLALFWNLRMQTGPASSGNILLFPASGIEDPASKEALLEWTIAEPKHANYCDILSTTADFGFLRNLRDWLLPRIANAGIHAIDLYSGYMHPPGVIPYDLTKSISVEVEQRVHNFAFPAPNIDEGLIGNRQWIIDLLKDNSTLRAPMEVCPIPSPVTNEVLNAPFPPSIAVPGLNHVRIGQDSLSFRSGEKLGRVRYFMPTDAEFVEEILRHCGMEIEHDEKRICYEAALKSFDNVEDAGRVFSGISLQMLNAMGDNVLTLDELKGTAKLGKLVALEHPFLNRLEPWLSECPIRHRIAKKRFSAYLGNEYPSEEHALEMLQYLLKLGVVAQCFRLPKCHHCGHEYTMDQLNLQQPILCPGCTLEIPFTPKFELAYRIAPLFRMAQKEGFGPVILTGRFLKRLSDRGFIWIPGIKVIYNGKREDIDVISFCDGEIVMAECKSMLGVPAESEDWKKICEQFSRLLFLAKACEAKMALFASMAESYPSDLVQLCKDNTTPNMSVHILNREDLESGYRWQFGPDGKSRIPIRLHDLLPIEVYPEPKVERMQGVHRAFMF